MKTNNVYYFDKKENKTKSHRDNISRDLRFIPRADNSAKSLSDKARNLATNYFKMISKMENGVIFVNSDFISTITERTVRQNHRFHKELADIFIIKYHQVINIEGKKYRDGFTIQYTENTEQIIADPKQFYLIKNDKNIIKNVRSSRQKCPQLKTKMSEPLYIEKNINKNINNRSMESSGEILPEEGSKLSTFLEKTLKDFHPLAQEDCTELQKLSGRGFTLNATNQILLAMSKRLGDRSFNSRKGFIAYFAKCLQYEKRDEFEANKETFRIKENLTEEDIMAAKRYQYLEKIEYSLEVSPEWHFKKKIACVLDDKTAYDLLTAYQTLVIKDHVAKLYVRRAVELTPVQHKIVLEQIKASHADLKIHELELPVTIRQSYQNTMKNTNYSADKPSEDVRENNNDFPMWQKFKSGLHARFVYRDPKAELLFQTWFEKLERAQNVSENKLILTGSNFMISFIKTNYESILEGIAKDQKINIEFVFETNQYPPYLITPTGAKF